MISNTKDLRKWLEARGVAVVGTRTRRDGTLTATSCFYYGPARAHCFRHRPGSALVIGCNCEDGHERAVASYDISYLPDGRQLKRAE